MHDAVDEEHGRAGLLARHDYDVEISGGTNAAHYLSDYDEAGIKLPTKHRIFPRTPDDQSPDDPMIVSIDLSEIVFGKDVSSNEPVRSSG